MDNNTKQEIDFMKSLGFATIDISYDSINKWTYAKQVSETPEHLTNGTSFWVVSRNQSKELKRLINAEVTSVLNSLDKELMTIGKSLSPLAFHNHIQSIKDKYSA